MTRLKNRVLERDNEKISSHVNVSTHDTFGCINIEHSGIFLSLHFTPAEVVRLAEILSESALLFTGEVPA